jgi:hypothetical protein
MSIPGFSADASLGRSVQPYATAGMSFTATMGVSLALGLQYPPPPPNCPTFGPCDSKCMSTVKPCTGGAYQVSCCGTGFECKNGSCVCPAPNTACGRTCTNLQSDPNNCGGCGRTCVNGQKCSAGSCICPSGTALTNGVCCAAALVGSGGICCPAGQVNCGGTCVDLSGDPQNCGSCGNSCGGQTCCGGACTDTNWDSNNCGGCGNTCDNPFCFGGYCVSTPITWSPFN